MEREAWLQALGAAVRQGGDVTLSAGGFSMGPRWTKAGGVVVRPVARTGRMQIGDIVVFEQRDHWVAHRLVWTFRSSSRYLGITKGDGLRAWDHPWLTKEQIVGRVVGRESGGRMISLDRPVARLAARVQALWGLGLGACWLVWSVLKHSRSKPRGRLPPPGGPA